MENPLIKAIKTEEQYKTILQQIKRLWSCAANSPEADLLEVLSILADDYENKHYPIAPPIQLRPSNTKWRKTTWLPVILYPILAAGAEYQGIEPENALDL